MLIVMGRVKKSIYDYFDISVELEGQNKMTRSCNLLYKKIYR